MQIGNKQKRFVFGLVRQCNCRNNRSQKIAQMRCACTLYASKYFCHFKFYQSQSSQSFCQTTPPSKIFFCVPSDCKKCVCANAYFASAVGLSATSPRLLHCIALAVGFLLLSLTHRVITLQAKPTLPKYKHKLKIEFLHLAV